MKRLKITFNVLICILLVSCSSKTAFIKAQKSTAKKFPFAVCGGFTTASLKNINLKDSAIIYGKIINCAQGFEAPRALIRIYNERLDMIDSVFTDNKGLYKKKIIAGTYKIHASSLSAGIIETTYLDFNPTDSINISLFLSDWPSIKH